MVEEDGYCTRGRGEVGFGYSTRAMDHFSTRLKSLIALELFHYWSDAYHNERIHNSRPTNRRGRRPGTVPIVPFPLDFQAPELIVEKLHAETPMSFDPIKFINTWKTSSH